MAWNGDQRRSGKDRRLQERRQTTRYGVRTLVIIDGITWIDLDGADRRLTIRRREDRENVAGKIVRISRP
jgi:hypothetical protein